MRMSVSGRSAVPIPSKEELERSGIGAGDYVAIGVEFLDYLTGRASLGTDEAVLEVGCGIGRIAHPLTSWIAPPGFYEGFDVVRATVDWCRRHITPSHPHFRFQWSDVSNSFYNPRGRVKGDASDSHLTVVDTLVGSWSTAEGGSPPYQDIIVSKKM